MKRGSSQRAVRLLPGTVPLLLALALQAVPGAGQQGPGPGRDLPPLSGFSVIPFSFDPPGARSWGMGGAFIALADDATAAEANPAGLTNLSRPEISIHGRTGSREIRALDRNAVTALDSLNRFRTAEPDLRPRAVAGNAFARDTRATFEPSATETSFASYVHPHRRLTWSVYYQRSANFAGENTFTAFDDSLLDRYRTRQKLSLDLDNLGVSLAFKAGERVSLGASLRLSTLTVDAFQDLRIDYLADLELADLPAGSSLEEVQGLPILDQQIRREDVRDEQSELTFNVGVLFNPGGRWSLGAVYKQGGDFVLAGSDQSFGCLAEESSGNLECSPPGPGRRIDRDFRVPDFLGVGLALRVTNRFKVLLDANRITYSDLTIPPPDNPDAGPGVGRQFVGNDDVTELHLGLELSLFLGSRQLPLTLRAGAFHEPDHDSFVEIDSERTSATLGLGVVLAERFQIDAAGQFGSGTDSGVLSLVYRF